MVGFWVNCADITSPDKRKDLFLPLCWAALFISAAAWDSVQPWQAKCCCPPATKKMPSKFCPTALLANQLWVLLTLPPALWTWLWEVKQHVGHNSQLLRYCDTRVNVASAEGGRKSCGSSQWSQHWETLHLHNNNSETTTSTDKVYYVLPQWTTNVIQQRQHIR